MYTKIVHLRLNRWQRHSCKQILESAMQCSLLFDIFIFFLLLSSVIKMENNLLWYNIRELEIKDFEYNVDFQDDSSSDNSFSDDDSYSEDDWFQEEFEVQDTEDFEADFDRIYGESMRG
ncbi:hypothetical protein AVEN_39208-1 [Araneus ventricosus]|uniref:Uncharacterized protein n=1 Tax=Araneus ventricosus TaxID=182803 RepID=A0A4Y2NJT2_ARAVE|nr:hypothetical protein AVEN_39208-1 [Araneus ventricosus]